MAKKAKVEVPNGPAVDQNTLTGPLAQVRTRLEEYCAYLDGASLPDEGSAGDPLAEGKKRGTRGPAKTAAALADSAWPALDTLCAAFGLTAFERELLLLCAGIELDTDFGSLCAVIHGDPRQSQPTFGLALSVLAEPHWSALSPNRPLRYWRLIEVGSAETLTTSPLKIDERVLHFLIGVGCIDERLQGLVKLVPASSELPPSQKVFARELADLWQQPLDALVQLCGGDQEDASAVTATACENLGIQLYTLNATDIPLPPAERDAFLRLWERESIFSNSALAVECDEPSNSLATPALTAFLEAVRGPVVAIGREPIRLRHRAARRLEVRRPSASEQRSLWRQALGADAARLNGHVESVAAQFNLGPQAITAASAEVREQLTRPGDRDAGVLLWNACRAQARPRLDDLAHRIAPKAGWDDLVIPESQMQELHNIAAQVRQRGRVYDDWGFAGKCARGLGISVMFCGPSGTGKTMAAEVLAGELNLDLYRIDLSAMVSKYVGETEKNLRRIFTAAEDGGAILLFDEADALFGKRSEVKDSHDRYANIEVSYLLQQMETYRGLTILTTNMKSGLDKAFLRRLRFVVPFPFPDAAERAEIWRRVFPRATPTEGLDPAKLARLSIAGGNIRNIALNATFLAADAGDEVRMVHLLSAARSEYAKLEKPLSDAELGGWV
jgi:hypothetical protein